MAAFLAVAGCGTANAAVHKAQPTIEQRFLSYIPPNEPVAPHNMEWLVDHITNNPGYYHSGHLPGVLTVKKLSGLHGYNPTMNGKNLFSQNEYSVTWKVGSDNFLFYAFQIYRPNKSGLEVPTQTWALSPISKDASILTEYVYTQS